jgi:hypothetical protein
MTTFNNRRPLIFDIMFIAFSRESVAHDCLDGGSLGVSSVIIRFRRKKIDKPS